MISNPFDVTKAVDYTDAEIYKYWVDLDDEGQGFERMIKPDTLMPMIIVGSKGSGKTHVMKYFSYELQKIRCQAQATTMQEGLAKEKFIGVYIRCSGFNSNKFSGKGVDPDDWAILHSFFWELWVGERLVDVLIDLKENGSLKDINETEIVKDIANLFLKPRTGLKTFEELNCYIIDLQRNIDYQVQNFVFDGLKCPNVDILLTPAKLTYGIPNILKNKVPFFKNKYILYLIDELENFSVEQQQLIQTLIREKPVACTFRIGTRPYGVRTFKTLGGVEENHDGSEFEGVVLDAFLRSYKNYSQYISNILRNRLIYGGVSIPKDMKLEDLFECQGNTDTISAVKSKKPSQSRSYLSKLEKDIETLRLPKEKIRQIMSNISFEQDILIERTSVMLMYRAIKDNKNIELLVSKSIEISKSAKSYFETKDKDTKHATVLEKFKQDIIDNLAREGRVEIPYNGLQKLIELSCGTPRTILRLLKAAFSNQYYNTGKVPFEEGRKLCAKSQRVGIESTYDWFFEENRIPSANQAKATDAVIRLGDYLRKVRFSDAIPQCSINIFTLNPSELSKPARDVFDALVSYSYIVQTDERRQINSDNKTHVYRLNSILLPKYELGLSKRGSVNFTTADAELFFNLDLREKYESYVSSKMKGYNFPFGTKPDEPQQLTFEASLF